MIKEEKILISINARNISHYRELGYELSFSSFTEKINLTDEEVDFIDKYVSNFNGDMSEGVYNVNYKVDFIQTDELVEVEEVLLKKIQEFFENYEPNLDDMSDWHRMEIDCDTLDKENKTIEIQMSFEHYAYHPSED